MADYIAQFTVDPAPGAGQFYGALARLVTDPELQHLSTQEGLRTSVNHYPDGSLQAILAYCECDEQGREWRTTASIKRVDGSATVRVEMTPSDFSGDLYQPAKPAIIDVLLDYFGSTGKPPFKASKSAFVVKTGDVACIEALVSGTSQAECPVIYATREFLVDKAVEPDELALRLYGLAYILIERDKYVGRNLQKRFSEQYGQLGFKSACLFWPDGQDTEQHTMCLGGIAGSGGVFLDSVEKLLQDAVASRELCNASAWLKAGKVLWGDYAVQTQRAETRPSAKGCKEAIDSLAASSLPTKQASANDFDLTLLQRGVEQDFSQNEALEMVLDAIECYLDEKFGPEEDRATKPCRRADVLHAVLDANPLANRRIATRLKNVKSIVTGKRSINTEAELELRKIGIQVNRAGKHPKLTLGESNRYKLTVASSGSDVNGWKNVVQNVQKRFF